MSVLTVPQRRLLDEVIRDGERRYDGRHGSALRALRNRGLVDAHLSVVKIGGGGTRDSWVVRPVYVAAFCSWCSGRVADDNRVTLLDSNGRLYQFNDPACLAAFERRDTS